MGVFVNVWQLAIDDPVMLAPIAIFFIVFGLAIAVTDRQSPVAARLARHRMAGSDVALVVSPPELSAGPPRLRPPAAFGRLAARFHSEKSADQDRALLNYAGSPMSLKTYARIRRLFGYVLTPLFAVLALVGLGLKPLGIAAAAIVDTRGATPARDLPQAFGQKARQTDGRRHADVLDLLVVCVEGGQTLTAALMQLSPAYGQYRG